MAYSKPEACSKLSQQTFQHCFNVVFLLMRRRGVGQRQINVVYFNVELNKVRQRRNNVVIFNVEFYNVDKCRNNIVKITLSKKNKKNYFK